MPKMTYSVFKEHLSSLAEASRDYIIFHHPCQAKPSKNPKIFLSLTFTAPLLEAGELYHMSSTLSRNFGHFCAILVRFSSFFWLMRTGVKNRTRIHTDVADFRGFFCENPRVFPCRPCPIVCIPVPTLTIGHKVSQAITVQFGNQSQSLRSLY